MIIVGSTVLALAELAAAKTNRATTRKLRIWINRLIFDSPAQRFGTEIGAS
jgi:hypothetical protein